MIIGESGGFGGERLARAVAAKASVGGGASASEEFTSGNAVGKIKDISEEGLGDGGDNETKDGRGGEGDGGSEDDIKEEIAGDFGKTCRGKGDSDGNNTGADFGGITEGGSGAKAGKEFDNGVAGAL